MSSYSYTENMRNRMHDQAAHWVARLRSDAVTEEDHQQFALWLAANPEHRRSMDTTLEMWDDLAVVRALPLSARPRRRLPGSWVGAGIALAASVMLALLLTPQLGFDQEQQIFRTRLGEQLTIDLADGSHLTLNTDSRLQVDLGEDRRELLLSRGEAFFDVAKDPDRPFIVRAGNAEVRALGTAFNIYLRDDEESTITVTEGVVRVTELDAPASRAADVALLYVNQSIASDAGGLASPVASDSETTLAWRDGKIVAHNMKLLTLVRELSRYHPRQIVIPDAEVGQLTFSGVFELKDPDTTLRALEHSLAVRSIVLADGSVQLIKAPL
jgi:transmembrane sensor